MNNLWFFNRYGEAQIILDMNARFIDRQGNNLGYIKNGNLIYNYTGKHCGWIEGYVIRDLYGQTVGFTFHSNDFPMPIFPIPQIPPYPPVPKIPPMPFLPQLPNLKPIKTFGWSDTSLIHLFN